MTVGTLTLTASDTVNATITGSENVSVTPAPAVRFVATPLAATTAGVSQSLTLTAYDAFGNVSTVYAGTVLFSSSDVQAGLPAAYTFTSADAGVHTFTVTLKTAGSQSVTVTDSANGALKASQSGILVSAGAAATLAVTAVPATTAGVAQSFTVTARDAFGNVATGYTGTLVFSSSDAQAALPAAYTFTAADGGVHTFSVTFKTAGSQSFTVADAVNPALSSTQTGILVTPGAVTHFGIVAPASATKSVAFSITVSALDAYGNVVTGYRGKVQFIGTSGGGGLPQAYTFTAADAGVHTFTILLNSTGPQTVTLADVANVLLKSSFTVNVTAPTGGGGGGGGTGGGGGGGSGGSGGGGG